MSPVSATRHSLRQDLVRLGIHPGDTVMVHAGLRTVGAVKGGAATVVAALLDAIGPHGTLAAYVDFEPFFEEGDEEGIPVFDKRTARAVLHNGVLAETIRTWPGAIRSDHPDAGVSAIGARAEWLTADHPLQYGYGPGSPLDKLVQAGGRVLMLGAPLDTVTLLHYAEHLARIPDKRLRHYRRLLPSPAGPRWIDIEEFDTSDPVNDHLPQNCFEQIAQACLAAGHGRHGRFGHGPAFLFEAPALLRFAVDWLEAYPLY